MSQSVLMEKIDESEKGAIIRFRFLVRIKSVTFPIDAGAGVDDEIGDQEAVVKGMNQGMLKPLGF